VRSRSSSAHDDTRDTADGTDAAASSSSSSVAKPGASARYAPSSPSAPYITHNSVFYRMLRPEFLQHLKRNQLPPLSPDALSGWSLGQVGAITLAYLMSIVTCLAFATKPFLFVPSFLSLPYQIGSIK
jgi:hypothetical protein